MNNPAAYLIEKNLKTLEPHLNLSRCGLTDSDFTPGSPIDVLLRSCTHVRELTLNISAWDFEITDIEDDGYKRDYNYLTGIPAAVGALKALRILRCNSHYDSFGLKSIAHLENLSSLRQLHLGGNNIPRIEGLDALAELEILELDGNEIERIEGLEQLSRLEHLSLGFNRIALIEGLNKLHRLRVLDLGMNNISRIEGLEGLTCLESLSLNRNAIYSITGLETLQRLGKLNLSDNEIKQITGLNQQHKLNSLDLSLNQIERIENLEELSSLQKLVLDSNFIFQIEGLAKLEQLDSISLEQNQITSIDGLDDVPTLTSLNLRNNSIAHIAGLENVGTLRELNLDDNEIVRIEGLDRLSRLEILYLDNNEIQRIEGLESVTQLRRLSLRRNQLRHIEGLQTLHGLQDLMLSENAISAIEGLENQYQLRRLLLTDNQLTQIEGLENCTNLEELSLDLNQITRIEGLDRLRNLQLLSLTRNEIERIEGISQLRLLTKLELSRNRIRDIEELAELDSLEVLSMDENRIGSLAVLSRMPKLKKASLGANLIETVEPLLPLLRADRIAFEYQLDFKSIRDDVSDGKLHVNVEYNPLIAPGIEVVLQGNEAIVSYFDELAAKGKEYLYEAKLLIVGQPRAGKTSLRRKLFDELSELPKEEQTTRGIDIRTLSFKIKNKDGVQQDFHYHVWDFGGQQIYQATHQFFLTHRSLYVLVLDTGKDSLGNDDATVNYWLQAVELLGGNSPLILVRNEKNERQISLDMSQKRARFEFLTSDFSVDLNALIPGTASYKAERAASFRHLKSTIELALQNLPLAGLPMPRNWVQIRNELQELSERMPHITRDSYIAICNRFDVTDFERQMELSRIFHDLGIFLHFQDFAALEEFIILQNVWATDAVFAVLDDPTVRAQRGRFSTDDLQSIWKSRGYEPSVYNKLVALMQQFELCYEVSWSTPRQFIIPEMLEDSAPAAYTWHQNQDLLLQYRYDFMPRGILTRLIVRLNHHIYVNGGVQVVWKTGVAIAGHGLGCPGSLAEITEAWDNKQLSLRVQGPFAKELMSKLTHEIDSLNNDYFRRLPGAASTHRSKWHKMIPCNCEHCNRNGDKHFYDYDSLLDRLEYGKETVECDRKPYANISIKGLMDGMFSTNTVADKAGRSTAFISPNTGPAPKKLFISYAHEDEESWKDELTKHLSSLRNQGLISDWHDRAIGSGRWEEEIDAAMSDADIFLLLITANFISSKYITTKEITKAYERYKAGKSKIIPIICDSCDWHPLPITTAEKVYSDDEGREVYPQLGQFQAFPKDGTPIRNWTNPQDGFLDVIRQLKKEL